MVPKTTATSMRPPSFGMADHGTFWSKPPTPTLFLEWPCCMATTYTYRWWRGAVLSSNHYRKQYRDGPCRTTACSRLPPASARASLPLPAAAHAQRCYDFQCQGSGTTFFRSSSLFSPLRIQRGGARKRRRVILLRCVGLVPPSLPPSGACLNRGTS